MAPQTAIDKMVQEAEKFREEDEIHKMMQEDERSNVEEKTAKKLIDAYRRRTSQAEIDRMAQEAEKFHANAEDEKFREEDKKLMDAYGRRCKLKVFPRRVPLGGSEGDIWPIPLPRVRPGPTGG